MGIVIITIVVICIIIFINDIRCKRNIDKRINDIYIKVESLLGMFIEKWDEEYLINTSKRICTDIEHFEYSYDNAINFINYANKLSELIYNNNQKCIEEKIEVIINKYAKLSGDSKRYITSIELDKLSKDFEEESKEILDKAYKYENLYIKEFIDIANNPKEYFEKMNVDYIKNEKLQCKEMFDNIENKSLDENQRNAVVNDDMRQLVIAGAGSGKTLTMAAKVKYLVERKGINPKDILLLSFSRKAATEMGERVRKLGIDIDSLTFHKYGLQILGTVNNGKLPEVYDDIRASINDFFANVVYKNEKEIEKFLRLLGIFMLPTYKSEQNLGERIYSDKMFDLTTLKGMYESYKNKLKIDELEKEINVKKKEISYLTEKINNELDEEKQSKYKQMILDLENIILQRTNKKLTIKNEKVKSREEVKIANLLFLNGIEYKYEAAYPYDVTDGLRKKYHPDFYLNESNIYLEHFGITKDGRAPQYDSVHEKEYLKGIKWKEEIHKKYHTSLIKTYSWQFKEDIIEEYLKTNFEKFNIKTHKVNYKQILAEIIKSQGNLDAIDSLISLLVTFISLFKANNFNLKKFDDLIKQVEESKITNLVESKGEFEFEKRRNIAFLEFAKLFYIYYTNMVHEVGMIDFNDMINDATKIIEEGRYVPCYKYVIVDEYQDISMGRYKLINATLEKSGAKLCCFGDDWQSIYRFTGSEVELFVEFEKFYGVYSRTNIEATYRNSQELLDISGKFIMMNQQQIAKHLISNKSEKLPLRIKKYQQTFDVIRDNENIENGKSISEAFNEILIDIIMAVPNTKDILVLGRNNNDINILKDNKKIQIEQVEGEMRILHKDFPNVKIKFLTIHKSKGLEADNVIIINMQNSINGFPNKIADDPILNLIHNVDNVYPFAEERRLFYVALTRTKNLVYLLIPNSNYSRFLDDIYSIIKENQNIDTLIRDVVMCPICKTGVLVKRKGIEEKTFVGCSNYPVCTYTMNDVTNAKNTNRCPICGDFLVKRKGKYGEFIGCLSYPSCTYTQKIEN